MPDNKSPDDLRSRYKAIKEERQRRINEHKRSIAARPATATNLKILADVIHGSNIPLPWT